MPEELAAIRRSSETGLPYGERSWVAPLRKRLQLDIPATPSAAIRKFSPRKSQPPATLEVR